MTALSVTPVLPPPPGTTSNFANPDDRVTMYIVPCSILLAVMILFVSLRFYVRLWISRSPGWDDLACLLATIGQISFTGLMILIAVHGVGKHMWDISILELPLILRYAAIATVIVQPTIYFTKLSLLLLYYRLFSPNRRIKHWILFGIVFCSVAYTLMTAIYILYIFWHNEQLHYVNDAVGAINLLTDIYLLCLPIAAVSKLQLPTRKRIGIIAIFLTGNLACIMSTLGLIYRIQFHNGGDETWDMTPVFIVATIENDVGIMCACMPFFPALLTKSSMIQRFLLSIRSLRSRLLGTRTLRTWPSSVSKESKYLVIPDRSVDDYLELGEARCLTKAPVIVVPKTFRMEFEDFGSDSKGSILVAS
ncbi:hypothetical protein MMC28_004582 [Mycoblastus sanguinarius]|nr:hypothetical protein [Mycoblastus sanguinarius]